MCPHILKSIGEMQQAGKTHSQAKSMQYWSSKRRLWFKPGQERGKLSLTICQHIMFWALFVVLFVEMHLPLYIHQRILKNKIYHSFYPFFFPMFNVSMFSMKTVFNVCWSSDPHIRVICEGSCDTEDWSNEE